MSSIFQDENLISNLLNTSIKHLEKFGIGENVNYPAYQLANKLIVDLKRQINPDNAPPVEAPIGTPDNKPLGLTNRELRNLGDFINWAANNKLTWNNKRFAWTEAEYKANPTSIPDSAAEFSAYTSIRDRESDTRQPHKVAAYALKQELIDFVTYIRDSEQNRTNRVLQVMIGSLINQINDNLEPGDKKIEARPSKGATQTLPPSMIIDGLPIVLSTNAPYEGLDGLKNDFSGAPVKLYVNIVNNSSTFRAFILNQSVKNDKGEQILASDPAKGDPCLIINILYKRAQYLVNTIGTAHDEHTPRYSEAAKLYLNKIIEVGKTLRGRDGKACSVGIDTTIGGTAGTTPGGQQALTPEQISLLQQILSNLPLHTANIDTNRIDRFLTALAQFDQGTKTSALTQNIAYREVQRIMGAMDGLMIGKYPQINLTMNLQSIEGLLKNGWKDSSAFIDNLRQLIIQTSAMLSALSSTWGYAMSPKQKQAVDAQINYIGNDNIAKINRWASALSRSVKVK